jgi:3-(3-hydroxy-phenyl)propionate hydroxylase
MPYDYRPFPYVAPPGLTAPEPRHKAVIVGAGPIGLALALELANFGVPSVVLDDNNVVSVGSRAICWSKRSLEILDRLGLGDRCIDKGVTWKLGRTFHGDKEVFNFDLLPEEGHKMPAFVNLQQYYIEEYLVEAAQAQPLVDLRFKNKVTAVHQKGDHAVVDIETPDGDYSLEADYLLACDGAKSPIRDMLGLEFEGELFEEKFLICDLAFKADFPIERRFWFEPPFHAGQTALLHKQADDTFRIDLQLGWDADVEEEKKPENVRPRIAQFLGHDDFEVEWLSIYTFQCRRLERFVHDRVIFVGDSAHIVSPFGARGGNGGLQDVDALGWRLAAVLQGKAPEAVLADYNAERIHGADENILNSTRSTRFMTPADGAERLYRDQVLALAAKAPFARGWVNSGRLSVPCVYPLEGAPDDPRLPATARPGVVAPDAPQGNGWLLGQLGGRMVVLGVGCTPPDVDGAEAMTADVTEAVRARYLGDAEAAVYLVRPDQVVAGRWVSADAAAVEKAIAGVWRTA